MPLAAANANVYSVRHRAETEREDRREMRTKQNLLIENRRAAMSRKARATRPQADFGNPGQITSAT